MLKSLKIKSIKKLKEKKHVYDLSVQENHNFFIGKNEILTHNCDFLTTNAQAALRNIMETYSKHCRFILTCNYIERIIEPIQSRCQMFNIFAPSKKDVALKLVEILTKENIKYTVEDVAKIVDIYYPDIRSVINSANRQVIDGKLNIDDDAEFGSDYKSKLLEYLKIPDKKEAWKQCRQLLIDSGLRDFTDVYRFLYDKADDYGKGKVSSIILILAEFQYKDALVVDKEINFAAMLVSLLIELHK